MCVLSSLKDWVTSTCFSKCYAMNVCGIILQVCMCSGASRVNRLVRAVGHSHALVDYTIQGTIKYDALLKKPSIYLLC